MLKFFIKKGTTIEYFHYYFSDLVNHLVQKYPSKKLLFVMDNLLAHKSYYLIKIVDKKNLGILFTPSHTPE